MGLDTTRHHARSHLRHINHSSSMEEKAWTVMTISIALNPDSTRRIRPRPTDRSLLQLIHHPSLRQPPLTIMSVSMESTITITIITKAAHRMEVLNHGRSQTLLHRQ